MTDEQPTRTDPQPAAIDPQPMAFSGRTPGADRRRIVAVVGACLAIAVTAAVAMGATPSPSSSADPDASGTPAATAKPAASGAPTNPDGSGPLFGDRGGFGHHGPFGGFGLGGITITSINGSSIGLATEDGWTRAITATSTTTITKEGAAATLSDLAVGDRIRLRQERADDGSFTITAIDVVQPMVGGTVTSVSGSTIAIAQPDGSTVNVNVSASTMYDVAGNESAKLSDVTVGMRIVAAGKLNSDGSLDATKVHAGNFLGRGHGTKPGAPGAPAPSTVPDASSTPG
jgi:hypothetical protein